MENPIISNQNMAGDIEESRGKDFFEIIKEHKKEIAIGAAMMLLVGATVVVVKNQEVFKSAVKSSHIKEVLFNSLESRNNAHPLISDYVSKSVTSNLPIDNIMSVRDHIRNLPEGWNPSTRKVESAANHGYSLEEHQTWVNAYTKVSV